MKNDKFETWEDAFSVCRERDKPMMVSVNGEVARIFPSGRHERKIAKAHPQVVTLAACAKCGANAVNPNTKACMRCGGKQQ